MFAPGRKDRAREFAMLAILGTLNGKTPEQVADEWIERNGWDKAERFCPICDCKPCESPGACRSQAEYENREPEYEESGDDDEK